jgi:hypothetical protein
VKEKVCQLLGEWHFFRVVLCNRQAKRFIYYLRTHYKVILHRIAHAWVNKIAKNNKFCFSYFSALHERPRNVSEKNISIINQLLSSHVYIENYSYEWKIWRKMPLLWEREKLFIAEKRRQKLV